MTKKNNPPPVDPPPQSLEERRAWLIEHRHPAVDPFWHLNDDPPRKPATTVSAELVLERDQAREQLKKSKLWQKTGGDNSGVTRLAAAEEAWRNDAFNLALAIRAENPSISQESLATEIVLRWKGKKPCRESMLVTVIREWEQAGKLPRRQK